MAHAIKETKKQHGPPSISWRTSRAGGEVVWLDCPDDQAMSLSPRAGEDQGPAQTIGQEECIPLPTPFCSTQAFMRQDTAHPHCGGSAESKAKLFRKHPETAFNQPSGAAVAWSSWPMKLDIIGDKEPSCLVPRESDTSLSRDQWHHVAEPELWAGSESTRQVTESMHVCWGEWGRDPRH